MDWSLLLPLLVQVGSICFFAGVIKTNQTHNKESIKKLESFFKELIKENREHHKEAISNLENSFKEKINDLKVSFCEKLGSLEAKQDKHNGVIERTYCLERDVSVIKEQIKVENHRIDDLEEAQHDCQKRGYGN